MAMQQYLCEVHILGQGPVKNVVMTLPSASQAEAKKVAETLFPGRKVTGVYNIKLKK